LSLLDHMRGHMNFIHVRAGLQDLQAKKSPLNAGFNRFGLGL